MAAKVDQMSSVSGTPPATTSSPKVSMFGAKSGFVIPKNKLSGSMVPTFRGISKFETTEATKDENKQTQRKTKWGSDLTQDSAVKRGRILAYQTRVEQITKQLKSECFEVGDDDSEHPPVQNPNPNSSEDEVETKTLKFTSLDLERREIIGEILRLNPGYKVPSDYKPLLKEATVPIPFKYPGHNFVNLILGPESKTQKRLEEETGAKVRVFGVKADTKEKRVITQIDENEVQGFYEELYVHVSSDTFEKVDSAVGLILLLVTPIAGKSEANPATLMDLDTVGKTQGPTVTHMDQPTTTTSQGLMPPPLVSTLPVPAPIQFQQHRWIQTNPLSSDGSPSTFTVPSNAFFNIGARAPVRFGHVPRNPLVVSTLQPPLPESWPVNPLPHLHPNPNLGLSTVSNSTSLSTFPLSQPPPAASLASPRFIAPPVLQSMSAAPSITFPNRLSLASPITCSISWSGASPNASPQLMPNNLMQIANSSEPIRVGIPVPPSTNVGNVTNILPTMNSPFPPSTQMAIAPVQPSCTLPSPSVPIQMPSSSSQSLRPLIVPISVSVPPPIFSSPTQANQSPARPSVSVSSPLQLAPSPNLNFSPLNSSANITNITPPRFPRPNSGDFTFQPRGQPPVQPTNAPPQAPSFRPAGPVSGQQTVISVLPNAVNQIGRLQGSTVIPPPNSATPPLMSPSFTNPNPGLTPPAAPSIQVRPPGFLHPPLLNSPNYSPVRRPINENHLNPNRPFLSTQPLIRGNYNIGQPISSPSGAANQIYDPFSPTSASSPTVKPSNSRR